MTQRGRKRLSGEASLPGPAEEAIKEAEWQGGQLYYADLQYVMSHHHFRVDFCPHMNFLVGPNGAGKSATIIAIALCLGARTTITDRFRRLADAITAGHAVATIRVGIVNIGPNAWRPEDYGTVITVERKLRREGSSSMKLYGGVMRKERDPGGENERNNAELRPVEPLPGSTATEELRTILDRFHIQPNNPCNILMQEKARKFIIDLNTKQLYKFWHEATLLTQIRDDLDRVAAAMESHDAKKSAKFRQMPAMEEKLTECRHAFEDMKERQNVARRILELQNIIAWVVLAGVEADLKQNQHIMQIAAEKITETEQKMVQIEATAAVELERAAKVRAAIDGAQEEHRRRDATRRSVDEELRAKRREVSAVEARSEHKRESIEGLGKRITRLDKEIADATGASAGRAVVQKLQQEKDQQAELLKAAEAKRDQLSAAMREAQARAQAARDEEQEMRDVAEALEKRKAGTKKRLDELQRRGRPVADNNSAEGERIRELVARNVNRFKRPPLGPVGALVTAKDAKFCDAVESAIRGSLNRFLVDNLDDDRALRKLCRDNNIAPPPSSIMKFQEEVYRTAANEPPTNELTILRVIKAEHPQVLNHLIDQFSIENTLVCEDYIEATEKIFNGGVRNAKAAFTLLGQKLNNVRGATETDNRRYTAKRIMADVEGAKRRAQEELAKLESEERTLKDRLSDAQRRKESAHNEAEGSEQQRKTEEAALRRLVQGVIQLTRSLEDAEAELNVDVGELRQHRADAMKEQEGLEAEMRALRKELEEAKKRLEPFAAKLQQARASVEELAKDVEKYVAEQQQVIERTAKLDTDRVQLARTLAQLRLKRTEAETAAGQKAAELEESERKAREIGERPQQLPPLSSLSELQHDLEQQKQRARREAHDKQSPEEIAKQYEEAVAKFTATQQALNGLQTLSQLLAHMWQTRTAHCKAITKQYAHRTNHYFLGYASQRGYSGVLHFDHVEQTLEIDVSPGEEEGRRKTTTLSGGERMFSTVAFLLSMWMMVEAPFYALDEFDVFMDAMHRTESLRLLTNHARGAAVSKQFIFISPQSQDGIPKGNDSRTFVLHPPTRGGAQGTLDNVIVASAQAQ